MSSIRVTEMTGKLLLESCSTFEKSKEEWILLSKYNGSITNRLGNYRKLR